VLVNISENINLRTIIENSRSQYNVEQNYLIPLKCGFSALTADTQQRDLLTVIHEFLADSS
jgi:hypothetical protein